jgi:hypothetical protein
MILDRTWNKKEQKLVISYINKQGNREFYKKYLHHIKTYEYSKDGTGFLAAKKCVLPKNYDAKSSDKTINTCQKWETTTPGELVKDQVSKTMSSPQTQLEMVRTLDDALTALFDSLIDNLQKNGLNGISTAVNNGTTGITISIDGKGNIIDGNSPDAVYGAFSLKDLGNTYNSDGTILKRGIIQIQKDYIDSVNTNLGVFAQIMPSLGELDYCIPGPNTNWEANSQDEIQYQTENANQTVHSGFLGIGSSGNPVQKSQAEHYLAKLDEYRKAIAEKFGPNSPMLDPKSGTGYLSMARAGLELTSNIVGTADNVYNTDQKYKGYLSTATSNLPQLNAIKNKYNDIVKAAQKRREQDNKNNGIASTPASCAKDELIN